MPPRRQVPPSQPPRNDDPAVALADRIHSAAIHVLRRVRAQDDATGLTAPRLSALSVLVFRGPLTLGELAKAEQVRPPTITKLVKELEREGLVRRVTDRSDRRVQRVHATTAGERLMWRGRARRVAALAASVRLLSEADRKLLDRAADVMERIARDLSASAPIERTAAENVRRR